jgi:hypothetical protein
MTSIVVFAFTSSDVAPPSRVTSALASLRPSELSFPVKTTNCPASGGESVRSGEDEDKRPLQLNRVGNETVPR